MKQLDPLMIEKNLKQQKKTILVCQFHNQFLVSIHQNKLLKGIILNKTEALCNLKIQTILAVPFQLTMSSTTQVLSTSILTSTELPKVDKLILKDLKSKRIRFLDKTLMLEQPPCKKCKGQKPSSQKCKGQKPSWKKKKQTVMLQSFSTTEFQDYKQDLQRLDSMKNKKLNRKLTLKYRKLLIHLNNSKRSIKIMLLTRHQKPHYKALLQTSLTLVLPMR